MENNLTLTLEQKLVMNQEMQLSLKLLQMSSIELQQYVDNELQQNAILEDEPIFKEPEQIENIVDYKEFVKYLEYDRNEGSSYKNNDEQVSQLNFISKTQSLKEFIREQIGQINIGKTNKEICLYLVENIDEKGYLGCNLNDVCIELKIDYHTAEHALEILQSLEPAGIAARNLKECLKIQLNRKMITDKKIYEIVDNYLEYLGEHKYVRLANILSITLSETQTLCDIIKALEPKPARGFFTGEAIEYIAPDAYIVMINSEFKVIMNDEVVPKIKINSMYIDMIKNESNEETINYVKDKIKKALFLINCIDKRKSTIYEVIGKIVEIQRDYFEFGSDSLKPMTLKAVADSIGVHESTVSRAINEKYISTNFGIIKIKKLFTKGLSTDNASMEISTDIIKKRIKELILTEDKQKPFSDQKICEILNMTGTSVARRTVAKYREQLGILQSSKRRRF